MKRTPLSNHEFTRGFMAGLPALNAGLDGTMAEGSRNQIMQGDGFTFPWQGLAGQGDGTGARLMRQILGTWGGLRDYFTGSVLIEGKGSIFSDIGKSIWQIGAGQPVIEGVPIAEGIYASTELQVSIARNGLYSAEYTFDAGMPQPSPPDIAIISTPGFGFTGFIEGKISCKIARGRTTTGARSVASKTSAVINPEKKTVRVTYPLPSRGQDIWPTFFTQSGFGGVGLHYRAAYQDSLDVPESVVAAGIIDGIPRSLEFDFKDGDLIPEVAYIDDYPPPAGTHAVRLANVMCVLGAYGDSTAPVTASDPGTVGAISLPNFYESYKPRYLVYFPEQIVDVMARPTDEYAYVGHRNCITALQYVGVQDGPAVAVSMVWPDIGIAKPHNWCQVHGLLYCFQAKGGPVRMLPDGSPDYSFAAPVRRYMRDWNINDTIVGPHPDSLSVVYFNGREALSWSLQANKWSPPCFFEDICIEDSPNPSSSPSASISPSASPSMSRSASPSASSSATPSASPSTTPSASPSSTPSSSPSPSASISASPSASGSASPSTTPSASPSATPSSSPSPSSSSSASPSASTAPFEPDDVSGITEWVSGDQSSLSGLSDGDSVTDWLDRVTGTRKWTGSAAARPLFRPSGPNGLPYLAWDSTDNMTWSNTLSTILASSYTMFIVIRPQGNGTNADPQFCAMRPGNNNGYFGLSLRNAGGSGNKFGHWTDRVSPNPRIQACYSTTTYVVATWYIVEIWCDGTNLNIKVNNDATSSIAHGSPGSLANTPAFGNGATATDIAEHITYNVDIGSSERSNVRNYLASKYAISIP